MTSPTNVLVVEDEMVLRMRAVDIVEDAGFTAVEAVNAWRFWNRVRTSPCFFPTSRCPAPWTG